MFKAVETRALRMPRSIPDDVREEVETRLRAGETPYKIAEDTDDISEGSVYAIRDEIEEELREKQEMEEGIFRGGPSVTVDDFEDVFKELGVGVRDSDGQLKAAVKRALAAIEMEKATEDPYHARDILFDEGQLDWKWAGRIVSKVFDMPNFPRGEQTEQRTPSGYGQRAGPGGGGPPLGYGQRQGDYGGGYPQGYGQGPPQSQQPYWAHQLQQQQEEQTKALEAVAGALKEDRSRENGEMIEVQRVTDDGDTEVVRVPSNSPRAAELLGGDSQDDMLTMLARAKEAGLIPDPSDFTPDEGPSLTDQIQELRELGILGPDESVREGLEAVAEAQKASTQQFQQALREVRQMAETRDESDPLTAADVNEILDEKLTKAERDQLRDELRQLREEVRAGDSNFIMPQGSDSPLTDDADVLTRHIDRQAERDQLRTVEHAGDKFVEKGIPELRQGIRELGWIMRYGQAPGGENAPGWQQPPPPGYTPPEEQAQPGGAPPSQPPVPEAAGGPPQGQSQPTPDAEAVGELWDRLTEVGS